MKSRRSRCLSSDVFCAGSRKVAQLHNLGTGRDIKGFSDPNLSPHWGSAEAASFQCRSAHVESCGIAGVLCRIGRIPENLRSYKTKLCVTPRVFGGRCTWTALTVPRQQPGSVLSPCSSLVWGWTDAAPKYCKATRLLCISSAAPPKDARVLCSPHPFFSSHATGASFLFRASPCCDCGLPSPSKPACTLWCGLVGTHSSSVVCTMSRGALSAEQWR